MNEPGGSRKVRKTESPEDSLESKVESPESEEKSLNSEGEETSAIDTPNSELNKQSEIEHPTSEIILFSQIPPCGYWPFLRVYHCCPRERLRRNLWY